MQPGMAMTVKEMGPASATGWAFLCPEEAGIIPSLIVRSRSPVMPSDKEVIRSEAGVTLTKVSLRSGSSVVAVAYVVKSKRTPKAPNFDNLPAAEIGFQEEVSRCVSA